jgi:response regulator RpfG family c-di-GMP phosphodiesterase
VSDKASKTKAVDLLFKGQVLTRAQYERTSTLLHATAERSEDVLIDNEIISEADLLKGLAAIYRTNFVSAEKLAKADIPRATVQMIPRRVAETLGVFPVVFDRASNTLSCVTPDPDNAEMLREVKLVSGAKDVKAFVARPAAIAAAIRKHHAGDPRAFERFERASAYEFGQQVHADGRVTPGAKRGTMDEDVSNGYTSQPHAQAAPPVPQQRQRSSPDLDADAAEFMGAPPPQRQRQPSAHDFDMPPPPAPQPSPRRITMQEQRADHFERPSMVGQQQQRRDDLDFDRVSPLPVRARQQSAPQVAQLDSLPPPQEPSSLHVGQQPRRAPSVDLPGRDPFLNDTTVELLAVMVSLLENARQELRGHSSQVARLLKRVAERMNLDKSDSYAVVVAGHIHDIGKMGQFHLTSYNCSEYEGHRQAALKAYDTPLRLLEAVRLPQTVKDCVFHMYERFDGKGFPDKLVGKEIPLGARLLAVADTYADLTQNPRNPFRKVLGPVEAMDVLTKHKGNIFDPAILDLFKALVLGEDMKAKLLANRHRALIVDPDPEESTVLELRLVEQGFDVKIARSADGARKLFNMEGIEFDLVISELELPDMDGLSFLAEARKAKWGESLSWVIHTGKQSRDSAQRAFELGVMDFVAKPVQADVLVAKIKAMLEQKSQQKGAASGAKGVSGSLREMGLPDIVQVLFHGRKTGNLRVKSNGKAGEIHFLEGAIANALLGTLSGTEAFYAMVRFTDGEFALDPSFVPPKRLVQESAEALLLEGMRRMDEGI